jgi:TPR repeat protein
MRPWTVALLPALAAAHSTARVSRAAIDACRGLDCWPEPEDAALACVRAIAALDDDDDDATWPLPPQGEFAFAADVAFDDRFAVAEPLARAGDGAAMQTVGLLRYYGVGGAPKDDRASARWHAAAAARGNVDGLAVLGGCVRRGVGADRLEDVGVSLVEAAAAAGSPVGLCKLGVLYTDGDSGLPRDATRAYDLFDRAAASGSALGLFNHGWSLVHGVGAPRDVDRGLTQWAAAARLAPDDGAEEGAFFLWAERGRMDREQRARYRPDACLRLAASLGFEPAVDELAAGT